MYIIIRDISIYRMYGEIEVWAFWVYSSAIEYFPIILQFKIKYSQHRIFLGCS